MNLQGSAYGLLIHSKMVKCSQNDFRSSVRLIRLQEMRYNGESDLDEQTKNCSAYIPYKWSKHKTISYVYAAESLISHVY